MALIADFHFSLLFLFFIIKRVSAIYLEHMIQGPWHIQMHQSNVDLIVLAVAYSSGKMHLLWFYAVSELIF